MDLAPYVDQLRRELLAAADVGGDEARAIAERLTAPLESSLRLALLSALSTAAEEITGQLAPGAVDVRLRGAGIGFVVTPPPGAADDVSPEFPPPAGDPAAADAQGARDTDDGATARITLRLPEALKSRVEDAAGRDGLSVNNWLVRSISRALEPIGRGGPENRRGRWSGGQHYSGWVR